MKLDFIQDENGAWVLEIKANSDFNLHLERASNYSQDVYLYVRGSSEGEYKLFKKLFGRVIDLDVDIPDAIVPKYYRIKCDSQPTLCEVTGNVENVTGVEVKPVGQIPNLLYVQASGGQAACINADSLEVIAGNIDGVISINKESRHIGASNGSRLYLIAAEGFYYAWTDGSSTSLNGAINKGGIQDLGEYYSGGCSASVQRQDTYEPYLYIIYSSRV